ncbi:MAG: BON domain-containing protein [Terracidiphilus sp.]|jgi:osmotically-inducible protein OsmY
MTRTIGSRKLPLLAAALFAALLTLSLGASAANAQDVASAVRAKLDKSQYKNVQVSVDANGIATLTGTVGLYEYKSDADKTVHKVKGVTAVRNDIEVAGATVPDSQLEKSLGEKLAYDRVGYGNVFDAITLQVQNGVVTLGGHAHNYPNRDSALGLVATTPGVKDVIDDISVDPVSPMDDRIRVEVARAIYSFPSLNRYAIDPEMPIRVSVQNGNVELYGMVDSEADKDAAFIRANGVSGVFSVKNYLQVANQPAEKQKNP